VPAHDADAPSPAVPDARERHLPVDGARADAPAHDATPPDSLAPDSLPPDGDVALMDATSEVMADASPAGDKCALAAFLPDNDTCATAIDLTAVARKVGGHTTYGDTTHYLDELHPPYLCTDYLFEDGPEAIYQVDLAQGERLTAAASPTDWDVGLYVLSTCASAAPTCHGADEALYGDTETLVFTAPAAGTYFLMVDSFQPDMRGCYSLHVSIL
jgi:hypothetical protein